MTLISPETKYKYELSNKEQDKFKKIYDNAEIVASKIIRTREYKQLSDENKKKIINSIYNYYFKKAKQDVKKLKGDNALIPENLYFKLLKDAYEYFLKNAIRMNELEQKKKG